MKYFSTNGKSPAATFREAVLSGQPADRGLYFPDDIPRLNFKKIIEKSKAEIAFAVIKPFVGGDIADDALFEICAETVAFDFPFVKITENIRALELFRGATLAFKDVGAGFMSRCLQYFSETASEKTIVVVATSGDTGGAVAANFLNAANVGVVILYPAGKVSKIQELQLTALGGNVTALEVAGTFDDCQRLAKQALADEELKRRVFLTSANSINVARWLPQQFYYFFALQQWEDENPPVVSVPSGNFGNICAGLLAHLSGLPARRFIAACNANDAVPKFLRTGEIIAQPAVATLSNAMDVANPSNFVRIQKLFGGDRNKLKEKMFAASVSDEQTANAMRRVYDDHGYVLDPHGAVAFFALEKYLTENPAEKGFFLATAHPVKFDSVEKIIGAPNELPPALTELLSRPKHAIKMEADYAVLKEIITSKI